MSKAALVDALKTFDLDEVRKNLEKSPSLKQIQLSTGLNLLQFCCKRPTNEDAATAGRQLRLAKWLVGEGFDPLVIKTTAPGEDGEAEPAELSLVFIAVAGAQNNQLARYFLELGASPAAIFAAVWWGNWEILDDLVRRGEDVNRLVGGTPLHMAIGLLDRGVDRKPEVARRRVKTLTELLRLGADPNRNTVDSVTPLHAALDRACDLAAFRLLLQHGANPDAPGKDGRTVRQIAARKKDQRYFAALGRGLT